jgi:hypothetical protein
VNALRKWEYKILYVKRLEETALNLLGQDEWELVSVVRDDSYDSRLLISLIFKRPLEEKTPATDR